jgi:hypothetical protein
MPQLAMELGAPVLQSYALLESFLDDFNTPFDEHANTLELGNDFRGLSHVRNPDGTMTVAFGRIADCLAELIRNHPLLPGITNKYPIGAEALAALSAPLSESNPLILELLPVARSVGGTC